MTTSHALEAKYEAEDKEIKNEISKVEIFNIGQYLQPTSNHLPAHLFLRK